MNIDGVERLRDTWLGLALLSSDGLPQSEKNRLMSRTERARLEYLAALEVHLNEQKYPRKFPSGG